jgi:8-oxo-dGTP pyrophosphatase MutT (NUDIX family)
MPALSLPPSTRSKGLEEIVAAQVRGKSLCDPCGSSVRIHSWFLNPRNHMAKSAIRAAGGLLWKPALSGPRLALVSRTKYADWTLPKGKLEDDEDFEEAALREVEEETGWSAILSGYAGELRYGVDGRPKVVRFWHMTPVRRVLRPERDEIAAVRWFKVDEALQQLTYATEREFVKTTLERSR